MNKLNDLVSELCPEGVSYRKFGDIATIVRGASPRPIAKYITSSDDGVNWVKIGDVPKGSKYITGTAEKITKDGAKKSRLVKPGDFVLSNSMSFGRPYIMAIEGYIHDGWLAISDFEDYFTTDFLYYLLGSHSLQEAMAQKASNGTMQNLNADIVKGLDLPVPPIPVQEEIVKILDVFSDTIFNLQTELELRKKQTEKYRERIFDFSSDPQVKTVQIKDVCNKVVSGGTPKSTNPAYYGGNIPWLRTQEVDWKNVYETEMHITQEGLDGSSAKWIPKNCVIVAMYGATAAKVGINKIPLTTNQACCNLEIDPEKALYKYVYYWLCKEYYSLKSLGQGSQSNINAATVKNYPIPIPSLEKQKEIVEVLDVFNLLSNDEDAGLLAELKLRNQQYEYYRDKLLNFKEANV